MSELLAEHVHTLRNELEACGFVVAETRCLQAKVSAEGAVLDSVLHHHLAQDSLSVWM